MKRGMALGFTLIELMTVVVIIALLVVVAYPSYQEHVRKGKRAEGKAALLKAAQMMERAYSDNNTYPAQLGPLFGQGAAAPVYSGENPTGGSYCISVAVNASTFTLTATPSGSAAQTAPCVAFNGGFTDPDTGGCGQLSLTNTGARARTGNKPMNACW